MHQGASADVSNEIIVFVRSLVSFLVLAPWMLRNGAPRAHAAPLRHLWRSALVYRRCTASFMRSQAATGGAMLLTYSTPLYVPSSPGSGWASDRPSSVPRGSRGLVGIGFIVKPAATST